MGLTLTNCVYPPRYLSIASGQRCVVEIRNYRKDGTLGNESYISPVKGEAGKVNYFIGVQNDIT